MKLTLARKPAFPTRIFPVTKDRAKAIADFSGDTNEITVRYENKQTVIYTGCGDRKSCTPDIVRTAAAKGVQKALDLKRTAVSIITPGAGGDARTLGIACAEGAMLGSYRFTRYKTRRSPALGSIECVDQVLTGSELRAVGTTCSAVMYARDCVNENASVVTPLWFAREAKRLSEKKRMRVTVLDEKDMARLGLRLIGAVGQASATPPRLIFMEYRGAPSSKKRTALVGKGITFDSGGQNLKPTGSIETMRMDMAGAAAVLGAMKAVAALRLKVNVIGCIAAAHNAIGRDAFFPGDIYPSFAGKTVEICSTDAEGRLLLADAVAFCLERFRPARIIDIATLTGGMLTVLADLVAGLFSNDDALAGALFASGEKTGERLWRLPLYQEFRDSMKSDLADLRNTSKFKKGYASPITGAAFIQEFVGDTPWAHLDIAGTGFNEGNARGEVPQFGTGFGVRLLVDFLRSLEKQSRVWDTSR